MVEFARAHAQALRYSPVSGLSCPFDLSEPRLALTRAVFAALTVTCRSAPITHGAQT